MMKIKKLVKAVVFAICLTMIVPIVTPNIGIETVEAATKIKLNYTKKIIYEGEKFKLKVIGTKKKVKWSSSNKKVATVTSKGIVKGISGGKDQRTCKITAIVGTKKYTCRVTVQYDKASHDDAADDDDETVEDDKPVNSVSDNLSLLKQFISKNGDLNAAGNRMLTYESDDSSCIIVYEKDTDSLNFLSRTQNSDTMSVASFYITSLDNSSYISSDYFYKSGSSGFISSGTFNPKTYSLSSDTLRVNFISSKTGPLPAAFQQLGNMQLELGFYGWELALRNSGAPVTLEDIGFTGLYQE